MTEGRRVSGGKSNRRFGTGKVARGSTAIGPASDLIALIPGD
jgi:hypothetical protein